MGVSARITSSQLCARWREPGQDHLEAMEANGGQVWGKGGHGQAPKRMHTHQSFLEFTDVTELKRHSISKLRSSSVKTQCTKALSTEEAKELDNIDVAELSNNRFDLSKNDMKEMKIAPELKNFFQAQKKVKNNEEVEEDEEDEMESEEEAEEEAEEEDADEELTARPQAK